MMKRTSAALFGLFILLSSVTVSAADNDRSAAAESLSVVAAVPRPRPQIMPSLYVSLAALQAYDGYSTLAGVTNGAREANPIVGGAAGKPVAMWSLKAASTAATIYYAERLWRSHRLGRAIALLVAANATMSIVAAHNASVLSSTR